MKLGERIWVKAAGLSFIAAALRFFKLGEWSLWIDEGNTLWLTQYLSGKRPTDAYPLFFWLERLMVEIAGTGEFALRLLPALLGVATVPMTYLMFRKPAGERTAFWAALLLALCPWHLFWSQNARYYTLLMVWTILLARLAWDWWEDGGEARLAGIVVVGLAGLMTQYTLILAWPALMAYPFLARLSGYAKDRRFAWRRIFVFKVALILPLLLAIGRMMAFSDRFVDIPRHYGDNPLVLLGGLAYRIGLPVGIALLAGLWFGLGTRDRVRRRFTLFLAAMAFTPALLAALATMKIIATSYYVFFALPFFFLLAGLALAENWESRRLAVTAGLLLAAFYLQGTALYFTVHHGDRIRWKEAVNYVERHREDGDKIIGGGSEAVSYYLGEEPALLNGTKLQTMIQWELKPEWRQPEGRTWYVVNDVLIEELDHDGLFRKFFREDCTLLKEYPLWNGPKNRTARIYLYAP